MDYHILSAVIFAVLLVLLGVIMFFIVSKKAGGMKYDERQVAGRGKAFEAGFYTTLICSAMVSLLEYFEVLTESVFVWHILALMVGVTAFALTAIHYEAYVSMTDTPRRFVVMGTCFTVAMLLSALGNFLQESETNHELGWINLMLAAVWVLIVAALLIHNRKKAEDEE